MKSQSPHIPLGRIGPRCDRLLRCLAFTITLASLLAMGVPGRAAPLSDLSFSEGAGTTTANAGSLADTGTFLQQNGFPVFSTSAPSGPYAPVDNTGSVDFDVINSGDNGRAIDFATPLGAMPAFTVCGWVNCRDLTVGSGGNRIVFALDGNSGRGFDLVHLTNGALQFGINQWPDGTPAVSSTAKITAAANADPANWVFFAGTYDSTLPGDQVKFYFGNANTPATLDVARTYDRGAIVASGVLTLGNFGPAASANLRVDVNSRVFRGLMDEIKVFAEALPLAQILAAQTNGVVTATPVTFVLEPVDQTVSAGYDATFTALAVGTPPIAYQWQRDNVDIPDSTNRSYTVVAASLGDNNAQFRVIATGPLGQSSSSNATLTVRSDITPPTVVSVANPRSLTNLIVTFSEPVEPNSAEDWFAYYFASDPLNVVSAQLQADTTNVLLTTEAMTPGQSYTLTIETVRDRAIPQPNTMVPTNWTFTAFNPPPRTEPMIETRFEEGSGSSVTNSGAVGGLGTIDFGLASSAAGLPAFTNNVPIGPYAPAGNAFSLYTGTGAGHAQYAGKAVDFPYPVKSNTIGLTEFTVSGWVNVTDGTIGPGGNRIISTWPGAIGGQNSNRLTGFDVVVVANGQFRLGVNQAPDYPNPPGNIGPTSASGKYTVSAGADPANWVFFAITYDASLGAENAKFYFGNANSPATKDTAATLVNYSRGPIADASVQALLSLANFVPGSGNDGNRDSTTGSRAFRGLMDEIRFFSQALTLEEIQQIQIKGGAAPTAPAGIRAHPANQTVFAGQPATFSITITGTPPIGVQWQRDGVDIPGATGVSYTLIPVLADDGALFRAGVSNELGTDLSLPATLTVVPEDGYKAGLPLDEATGVVTTNLGNLGGNGTFALQGGFPVFSNAVPVGPFAPAGNVSSVDFGAIVATNDGNRSIDFTNGWGNTLGRMDALTIAGWVNCRDLAVGSGGNRLVFALDAPNGRGFDLVHLANGALELGLNQWPDYSTATSSVSKVTADPDVGPGNWVFFAVTYDPAPVSDNVKYYFGNPELAAEFDVAISYNRGPLTVTGPLTLGNFGATASSVRVATGPGGSGSRVFRGLMDEISVLNRALTLDEIRRVQRGLPLVAAEPEMTIVREGNQIVIAWTSSSTFQVVYKDDLNAGEWTVASETVETVGDRHTVRIDTDQPVRFYRLRQ